MRSRPLVELQWPRETGRTWIGRGRVKTGFHSGAFAADPIAEVVPRLAALGFQGVELNAETAP